MSGENYIRLPRLHVDADLTAGAAIALTEAQAHYLRHVLRQAEGAQLRLFNGRDGEWLARLAMTGKRQAGAVATTQTAPQPPFPAPLHLIFAPIKKARLDFLIEKAVELGATAFQPVITAHTEVRQVNEDRLRAQIIEAAEQCERLDVPALLPAAGLDALLAGWTHDYPLAACLERQAEPAPAIPPGRGLAVLTGPEGGFDAREMTLLRQHPRVIPVSLGPRILRSETAALAALARLGTGC